VAPQEPEGVAVPIVWAGVEDVPILYVNSFVSQFDSQTFDSFVVTVGQLTQPALTGATPEDLAEQAEQISFVAVKPVVRLGLTTARMRELIATLQANLDQLEHANRMRPGDPR
jgi:hypothetical protein